MAINLANNNSLANITALPSSISGGAMTLLATQTASSSSTISFTSGIDDTYDSYVFKFYNIHASFDGGQLSINASIDGGSNYNVTKTTTIFAAQHNQADSDTSLAYSTAKDVAQGTGDAIISFGTGNGNDEATSGTLQLFNPSSTTFVKHFIGNINTHHQSDYSIQTFSAGYFNTTSALNAIKFDMDNGNIDSGVIKLYGVS